MAAIEHADDKHHESLSIENEAPGHHEDVERARKASFSANADLGHVLAGDERAILTEADNRLIRRKTDKVILTLLIWVYFLQVTDKSVLGYGSIFGLQTDTGLLGYTNTQQGPINHACSSCTYEARIISKILRDLYSIKSISANRRAVLTERVSKNLSDWRVELARFLDADYFSTSLLIPIFQRQRNVLNITYWHAIILAHRPFLLSNFAQLSHQTRSADHEDPQTEESVQQCLMAAMNTVNTLDDIAQNLQMFRAFWARITAYFAFTANIVLYIYVIQKRASPPDVYSNYLLAATRCQSHISGIAEKGSLSERYCLVLEELRIEVLRQTGQMHQSMIGLGDKDGQLQENVFEITSVPMEGNASAATDYVDLMGEAAIDFSDIAGSALSDYSGWGQFASMVSSGLGNLDTFLNDDPFKI